MTVRARLSLLDKNISTSARFDMYITEKLHTKNVMYFLDRGCVCTLLHLYGYTIDPRAAAVSRRRVHKP